MIPKSLPLLVLVVLALALAACGGSEKTEAPPPTVASLADLATQSAQQTAASAPPPSPTPVATVAPTDTPSPTATLTPPRPSETPTAPPVETTVPPEQLQAATDIALTSTAVAGARPFTQTAVAVLQSTQTASAQVTATPPPTVTAAPAPEAAEPFQIVYYTNRNGNDDIYLMTLNGTERRLVSSLANEREPSCSPDARSVVYASDATGSYQLYLLSLDQAAPVQITSSEGINFAPAFSPDGSSIVFVSTRNQGIPTIWMINADGSNPRQITTELGRDTSPSWGPDGRELLFSSDQLGPWNIFLTVVEDDVEGEFPVLPPEFSQRNQLWPFFDFLGERIAYTVWDDLNDPQTSDIYLLDFEQPEPLPVREGPGADIAWAWGDDTHLLASVGGPDDVQIALVDITTGDSVQLTHAGTFNGGPRLCTVPPDRLPPEPTLPPSPTPTVTPSPSLSPTASPSPTPTQSASSSVMLVTAKEQHIVQPGETLMSIGTFYGVKWQTLAEVNALSNPDLLSIGQPLTVPVTRLVPRPMHYRIDIGDDVVVHRTIVVELDKQIVKAYQDGRLVRMVSVSTGLPGTPTVVGEFKIYAKYLSQTMTGPNYYLPEVPYVMYFYQGYGLHGTYWHNNFGHPMSHGCVNLPTEDARWFYQWADIGTPVLVKQ
ncbi:MAG TPA: L,D-transpeptidase family protein [Aggregatilineaceae bacterium]|nr:L,D-transpeptidase family protein [Aggregatilineaceae bacterium]